MFKSLIEEHETIKHQKHAFFVKVANILKDIVLLVGKKELTVGLEDKLKAWT